MKILFPVLIRYSEEKTIENIYCFSFQKNLHDGQDDINTLNHPQLIDHISELIINYLINLERDNIQIPLPIILDKYTGIKLTRYDELQNIVININDELYESVFIKKGLIENSLPCIGMGINITTELLNDFLFSLGLKQIMNGNLGYIFLSIIGVICGVTMSLIIFFFSKAGENFSQFGRKADVFLKNKLQLGAKNSIQRHSMSKSIFFGTHESPITKSNTLIRVGMAIPALGYTAMISTNVYQAMIALHKISSENDKSGTTPVLIIILAIIAALLTIINQSAINIGFSTQVADYLYKKQSSKDNKAIDDYIQPDSDEAKIYQMETGDSSVVISGQNITEIISEPKNIEKKQMFFNLLDWLPFFGSRSQNPKITTVVQETHDSDDIEKDEEIYTL